MSSSTIEQLLTRLVELSTMYGKVLASLELNKNSTSPFQMVLEENKELYEQRIEEIKTEIQSKFKAK